MIKTPSASVFYLPALLPPGARRLPRQGIPDTTRAMDAGRGERRVVASVRISDRRIGGRERWTIRRPAQRHHHYRLPRRCPDRRPRWHIPPAACRESRAADRRPRGRAPAHLVRCGTDFGWAAPDPSAQPADGRRVRAAGQALQRDAGEHRGPGDRYYFPRAIRSRPAQPQRV